MWFFLCSYFLYLTTITVHGSLTCTSQLSRCFCSSDDVINCTDVDLTTDMFDHVPWETTRGIFVGNNFRTLPSPLFGFGSDYTFLEQLDLSRNNIEEIEPLTFHGLPELQVLQLSNNSIIRDLPSGLFSELNSTLMTLKMRSAFGSSFQPNIQKMFGNKTMHNLAYLELSHNNIINVSGHLHQRKKSSASEDNFICNNLPNLEYLDLSNNALHSLHVSASCLQNLVELDLSHNRIHRLDAVDIDTLMSLQLHKLKINDNPFICDCHAVMFLEWFQSGDYQFRIEHRKTLKCKRALPSSYANHALMKIPVRALQCAIEDEHRGELEAHHSLDQRPVKKRLPNAVIGVIVTLLIVIAGSVFFVVRRDIAKRTLKMIMPFSEKYRSLESEDVFAPTTEPNEETVFSV